MGSNVWSTVLAIVGIFVAVLGVLVALATPEFRAMVGLGPPTGSAELDREQRALDEALRDLDREQRKADEAKRRLQSTR